MVWSTITHRFSARECSLAEIRAELLEVMRGVVQKDEQPLACYCLSGERRNGGRDEVHQSYVITHQQLVLSCVSFTQGLLGTNYKKPETGLTVIDLESVNGIEEGQTYVYIRHGNHGSTPLLFSTQDQARKAASILRKAVQAAAHDPAAERIPDIADQIEKLITQRREGFLNQEEFEAAKRRLLGLDTS